MNILIAITAVLVVLNMVGTFLLLDVLKDRIKEIRRLSYDNYLKLQRLSNDRQ